MKIYYHSDDACLTKSSTEKILSCWENGFIDGFSVLANASLLPIVQQSIRQNTHLPVRLSIHLNLTDFSAVSSPDNVSLLTDKQGRFKVGFIKALQIHLWGGKRREIFIEQVWREWDAQINLVKSQLRPSHIVALDSHNYIHMVPCLFRVISDLSEKHDVPFIRVPNEPFYISEWKHFFHGYFVGNLLKFTLMKLLVKMNKANKYNKRQESMGILYSGNMFHENIISGLEKAAKRNFASIEVVLHVGKSHTEELLGNIERQSAFRFFTSEKRDKELDAVKQMKHE
ncbi:ChbG/HpnK family deacetylase [Lacibacter sp. H375]|uniref:ChbG/HpnK family deacetylase n=1 Tax=Lacibacter sp. H375 TaxID=3133424 RepID=UPI0030C42534